MLTCTKRAEMHCAGQTACSNTLEFVLHNVSRAHYRAAARSDDATVNLQSRRRALRDAPHTATALLSRTHGRMYAKIHTVNMHGRFRARAVCQRARTEQQCCCLKLKVRAGALRGSKEQCRVRQEVTVVSTLVFPLCIMLRALLVLEHVPAPRQRARKAAGTLHCAARSQRTVIPHAQIQDTWIVVH